MPRQIAMYLCRTLTDSSLPKIGQYFGGRDHTTVIHACEKIDKLRKEDKSFDNQIQQFEEKIRSLWFKSFFPGITVKKYVYNLLLLCGYFWTSTFPVHTVYNLLHTINRLYTIGITKLSLWGSVFHKIHSIYDYD